MSGEWGPSVSDPLIPHITGRTSQLRTWAWGHILWKWQSWDLSWGSPALVAQFLTAVPGWVMRLTSWAMLDKLLPLSEPQFPSVGMWRDCCLLSTLQEISSYFFNPPNSSLRSVLLLFPLHRRNWGIESFSNLLQVTQLVGCRAGLLKVTCHDPLLRCEIDLLNFNKH